MPPQKAQVRLYTRLGCHLCEVAKEQMLAANCADLYVLEETARALNFQAVAVGGERGRVDHVTPSVS